MDVPLRRPARFVVVALSVCLATAPAMAQSQAPRIDVERGQTVEILDDQEHTIRGKIDALSGDSISLLVDGTATEIHIDRITRIVRRGDNVGNGALWGLAIGAVFGFAAIKADSCESQGFAVCFDVPGFVMASTLFFGGVGAGIGAIVDAFIRGERVVYQREASPQTRVIPLLGKGLRGASLAVSW